MIYIGVDPGSKSGAYAVLGSDNSVKVYPWDNDRFISHMRGLTIMRDLDSERVVAVVEKVNAMPKQGVSSTWVFAENFGYIQGVLHAFGIPYQLVPPRVWKKMYSLTSDKTQSIEVCHRLFPDVSLKRTERSRVNDNNFAESVLIAEYARRKM